MDLEDNEDYEIISKQEIAKLKNEVNQVKQGAAPSESTVLSRLNQMLDLFREASVSMKSGPTTAEILSDVNEKLGKILDQNQQIAEGILAIADLVRGTSKEQNTKPESIEEKLKPKGILMPEPPNFNQEQPNFGQESMFQMPQPQQMPIPPMPPPNMPIPPMPPRMRNDFSKPMIPSLNPREAVESHTLSDLPPLPPRPPRKGLFPSF